MHAARFCQSPEAADFDVDDPAALEVERFARVLGRVDALVEADRRLQLRLQSSVVNDVVVGQGLFDHHQVQIVERAQRGDMRGVVERVGGIGIGHQQDVGPTLADGAQVGQVAAGADLHLDPLVALIEIVLDLLDDALNGRFDAQTHSGVDLAAGAAQGLGQRRVCDACQQIPARHLQASLGEIVAAYF